MKIVSYVNYFGKLTSAPASSAVTSEETGVELRKVVNVTMGANVKLKENTPDVPCALEVVEPGSIEEQCAMDTERCHVDNILEECQCLLSAAVLKIDCDKPSSKNLASSGTPKTISKLKPEMETCQKLLQDARAATHITRNKSSSSDKTIKTISLDEQAELFLGQSVNSLKKGLCKEFCQHSVDNWTYSEAEIMLSIEHFFYALDLVDAFDIDTTTLKTFIIRARQNYNDNPFHNFQHAFCVTQMMYAMIVQAHLTERLTKENILALIVSCLCHDLDHSGFNNAYHVNAQTDLAIRYNDKSPLENHHCAVTFQILSEPDSNIFKNVDDAVYRRLRKGITKCIMATDMGRHGKLVAAFQLLQPVFSFEDPKHQIKLMQILIKSADISNEVRPLLAADLWVDRLLSEFFHQGDCEKLYGFPCLPMMDRHKTTKASSQVGFIGFVITPLFETLCKTLPELSFMTLEPIKQALVHYEELAMQSQAASGVT